MKLLVLERADIIDEQGNVKSSLLVLEDVEFEATDLSYREER